MSNNELTLEEFLGRLRTNIILAHSQAEEISLKGFDEIARKYSELLYKIKTDQDKTKTISENIDKKE